MRALPVLLLMVACSQQREQVPTYRPYGYLFDQSTDDRIRSLQETFAKINKPKLEADIVWDEEWTFMEGSIHESLIAEFKVVEGPVISLPHKVTLPNHALWYSKRVSISSPGILVIHADDGAQLFIEGRKVNRLYGQYFPVATAGDVTITIRVLNNAMSGGLTRVGFNSAVRFQQYENQLAEYQRLKRLAERAVLCNHPSPAMLESVQRVLMNPTTELLLKAEAAWKQYPYLTGPWMRWDGDSLEVELLTDNSLPVHLSVGDKPGQLSEVAVRQGPIVTFRLPQTEGNRLHYQLISGKTSSPVYSIRKPESESFSFNVWADSQSGWSVFNTNIGNILKEDDAFGIGIGDLVGNGSDEEEWRMLFNILGQSAATRPYYLIAGNHDYDGYYDDLQAALYNSFTNTSSGGYRSLLYGNCAFIALDLNQQFPIGIAEDSEQARWFHHQLKEPFWTGAHWRFILVHQPPYSQGWPGYGGDECIRELLEPIMESAAIDFVVSGHTHDYERLTKIYGKQQTTFLITGGGGGSLEPEESSDWPRMDTVIKTHHFGRFIVNGKRIRFEARDLANGIIDTFEFIK
jgi:hypothetical protein